MEGQRQLAYGNLCKLSRLLARTMESTAHGPNGHLLPADEESSEKRGRLDQLTLERMTAKCWRKLGEWKLRAYQQQHSRNGEDSKATVWWGTETLTPKSVLDTALAATSYDKNWYRAWHSWAMVNLEFSKETSASSPTTPASTPHLGGKSRSTCNPFIVTALQGFIKSVAYSPQGSSVQDSLRLLTLWFRHSTYPEVNAAVGDGVVHLPLDSWLCVFSTRSCSSTFVGFASADCSNPDCESAEPSTGAWGLGGCGPTAPSELGLPAVGGEQVAEQQPPSGRLDSVGQVALAFGNSGRPSDVD